VDTFIGAALTMMLGSIPQQDVFQRMTSAKTEKIAVRGTVLGGVLYFGFAFGANVFGLFGDADRSQGIRRV